MDCPSCHKDITVSEQNYGALFTCPECQAVYFLNFGGQPEYDDHQIPPPLPSEDFNSDMQVQSPSLSSESSYQLDNPFEMPHESKELESFDQVAQSISDFGNTESQIATLNYDLRIRGLDSKDLMQEFKDAIQDSRFGWESSDIMKKIKSGEVFLEKLNPVVAYLLAKRLRFLGLELKWNQNVLE